MTESIECFDFSDLNERISIIITSTIVELSSFPEIIE